MAKRSMFVCGDSYMAPVVGNSDPDLRHFSELMSVEIFNNVINLAQHGCSNFGICTQIETAIKYGADFVLMNTTSIDRLDIPFENNDDHLLKRKLNVFNMYNGNRNTIKLQLTAEEEEPHIVSNNILSMLEHNKFSAHQYWKFRSMHQLEVTEKFKATKSYIKHLYNARMKMQTDTYMLHAVIHKLHLKNIPFLIILDRINILQECDWIDSKHKCTKIDDWREKSPTPLKDDPGYHTYPHLQQEAADIILEHIKLHWNHRL